jgi:hypothetical protein
MNARATVLRSVAGRADGGSHAPSHGRRYGGWSASRTSTADRPADRAEARVRTARARHRAEFLPRQTVGRLTSTEGEAEVEPGDYPSDALATLLGDVVSGAETQPAGDLRITFDSGAELLVGADPDVESWAVAGPDRFLIVCLARGELAVWGAS